MTIDASNDPIYARAPLPTLRMKRAVPPAEQMTPGMIRAMAQAAAKLNAKVLLSNGLRISPDGTVDRPESSTPTEG